MQLELTKVEAEELVTQLDQALGDLSEEIADTDNAEFRRELDGRRQCLGGVRAKLVSEDALDRLVEEQGEESFPASDPPAH